MTEHEALKLHSLASDWRAKGRGVTRATMAPRLWDLEAALDADEKAQEAFEVELMKHVRPS